MSRLENVRASVILCAMPDAADHFDFFVSYARGDNATGWLTRFVEELLSEHKSFAAGRELKPFFDQHAITTGADWQLYLAHGVAHSRLFLAFISPSYFTSEWCRKEWRAWIDAEIAQHILTAGVRPIYIVEVPGLTGQGQLSDQQLARQLADLSKLPQRDQDKILAETPPVLKHLRRRQLTHNQTFCDVHAFYDGGLETLRREDLRRVLSDLAHDLDHHAELLARAEASLSTVPAYNRNFTGRLDELLALRERLIKDDRTGVIYGVHGLGGIGKSELAYAYAHAYASAYPGGRFLLRCEGKPTLRDAVLGQSDFTALFRDRISDEERKQPDTYFAAVTASLRDRLDQMGHVLLVLDNVTDPALLLHHQTKDLTALGPKLHLLATTRLVPPADGKGNWLSLGQLPDDDALDLLEKYRSFASDAERAAARRIVKRLGGFTLAVELVAAHLAAHPGVTCAQMAATIGLEDLENPAVIESGDALRYDHDRRLSAVLAPTLAALSPAERRAVEYAAFLPPDHLPLPWLRTLVVADFPEIGQPARLTNPWDDLRRRLEKLALFTRPEDESTEPRLLRVHRLVQELVRRDLAEADCAARQQAVDTLVEQRAAALEQTTQWENARWELEPLGALAELWADTNHPDAAWLLNQAGLRWDNLAEWSRAEPLKRRALAIDEHSFGPDHPRVAIHLNNLAQLLKATNRLGEAEPLMRRALAIDEHSFGADDPNVATALNNLAALFTDTNRPGEAEPLMRRALAMEEQNFGPEHPKVAISLNNLGILLQATNRLGEAEPLLRRALAIDEHSFGADHPNVARDLNNLAALFTDTNRLGEAEPLLRRALAIDERSFGADHPNVATHLNNLAQLLQATNRLGEAEPLLWRALAINERSFGPDHPDVATHLNNLAQLLKATNRLAESEPLMRRALAIDERSFGPDHPNVAGDLNNLALLLQETNRLGEAEPLLRRALAIAEHSLGPDHPKVAIHLNTLAALLQATNRLAEAESLMRRALAIREQSLGENHPNVATGLNNLAQLLRATNRLDQAEPLMRQALAIDEHTFGPEHPKVARDLNNLAKLLLVSNRLDQAEPLMRRELAIWEQSLGENHTNVATALDNLAQLSQATNRLDQAEPLLRRALAIDEHGFGPDHPNVALRLNNLAQLLQATNRLGEAEPLMRRALAIGEHGFGPDHPEVATDLNNLAQLLQATNRLGEAEPLMRRALAIDEHSFGLDHPKVASALDNLAQLLQDTDRLGEAEPLMRRALEILLKFTCASGHAHPHLQAAVLSYAGLLQVMGRSEPEVMAQLNAVGKPFGIQFGGSS